MRLLRVAVVAGFVLSAGACGLDQNGLFGSSEEGGVATLEDASTGLSADATMGMSSEDSAAPDSGSSSVDSGGGNVGNDSGPTDSGGGGLDTGGGSSDAAADACVSYEICNNGIDDNCDGKIDCADPTCGAWTCTAAAVPMGWNIVEYAENSRPACATGYGAPVNLLEGPTGPAASCQCTCSLTPGSCTSGNFMVNVNGITPGCSSFPAVTSPGNNGACSPATDNYTPMNGAQMQVTPAGYTPGSCTPDPTVTLPAQTFQGVGLACQQVGLTGLGCPNQGACVPATGGGGFNLCIAHGGTVGCPPGFSHLHPVGTDAGDTRGCTPCTCGGATGTCTGESLTLFPTASCSDGGVNVPAGGCNAFPGPTGGGMAPTYVAYEYAASVQNEMCGPASHVVADGGVTLQGLKTICCQ